MASWTIATRQRRGWRNRARSARRCARRLCVCAGCASRLVIACVMDAEVLYRRVLGGYTRLAQVLFGQESPSSLDEKMSVLWRGRGGASGAISAEPEPKSSVLRDLVSYSIYEAKLNRWKGISAPHYLAFVFFAEKWLRSLKIPFAKKLADMAQYYRSWDGRSLYEHRMSKRIPGLSSVLMLAEYSGHGRADIVRPGDAEGMPSPLSLDAVNIMPFLHPALFNPMLRMQRSEQDDIDALDPQSQWRTVFGDRKMPRWIPVTIGKTQDWSGIDIRGASLVGASMPFCNFSGSILMGCDLSWSAMKKCDFSDAVMDAAVMVGADIEDSRFDRAKMRLANLSGRVNASYISAHYADMSGVKAAEINLSYARMSGATLEGAMMSMARLSHADLHHANMKNANLSKSEMYQTALLSAKLSDANLFSSDMKMADLTGADLERAKMSHATLTNADFRNAKMNDANLSHVNAFHAVIQDASLRGAILSRGNFYSTHFQGSDLRGAILKQADLRYAFLSDADFGDAPIYGAKMPKGFTRTR